MGAVIGPPTGRRGGNYGPDRSRPGRRTVVVAVCVFPALGLALLVSASFATGCETDGQEAAAPRCEAGGRPADPGAQGRKGVVLGCGRTTAGRAVELYALRDAGGPCLNIAGLPGGTRACGRAPSERVPPARDAIGGGLIVRRSGSAPLEVYGETAPSVRRVLLRYRAPQGRPRHKPATLIRATATAALSASGVRESFGYFIGAVPRRAVRVFAVALDASGEVLGRFGFDRLARGMHPTVFIARDESPG
jgi:hypothetical protein